MSNTRTFGTPGSSARSPDPAASQAAKTDAGGASLFGSANPNSIDIKQQIDEIKQKLNYVYDNYLGGSSTEGGSYTSILSNTAGGGYGSTPDGTAGSSSIISSHSNYIVNKGADETGIKYGKEEESSYLPLLAMLNNIDWSQVRFHPLYADQISTLTKFERNWVWEDTSTGPQLVLGIGRQSVLYLHDAEVDARTRYSDPDLISEYINRKLLWEGSTKYTKLHSNSCEAVNLGIYLNDYWRTNTDWMETNYDWPGNENLNPSDWGGMLAGRGTYDVASFNYVGLLAPSNLAPWPPDELQPHEPYLIPTLQSGQTISHEYYIDGHHPWADMQYAYDSEGNEYCRKVLSLHNGSVRLTANEIDFLDRWPRHSAFYDANRTPFIRMQYDPLTWAEHMEVNGTVTINGGYWREQGTTPGRYPGLHVYGDIVIHDGQIRYESS